MRLLIDGDVLCYRAGFVSEQTKYLRLDDTGVFYLFDDAKSAKTDLKSDQTLWSRKEVAPEEDALTTVDGMINEIRRQLEGDVSDVCVILSGVGNFRYALATRADYKGNRAGSERPKHYAAIRSHLIGKWRAELTSGEEADDLLGIEMHADPNSVCCSIDKDLLQIPGWHYNINSSELTLISPEEGLLNFYCQVLSGDAADNIPGLPGIGVIKARKAIDDCLSPGQCWAKCLEMYVKEFGKQRGKRYALEAARLVHIRTAFRETWNPPTGARADYWGEAPSVPCPRKPIEFSPIMEG